MFAPHLRLDGGCAADDGMSSSSLARLVRLLLGPAPRFAEDMLERSGELYRCQSRAASPAIQAGQGFVAMSTHSLFDCMHLPHRASVCNVNLMRQSVAHVRNDLIFALRGWRGEG